MEHLAFVWSSFPFLISQEKKNKIKIYFQDKNVNEVRNETVKVQYCCTFENE